MRTINEIIIHTFATKKGWMSGKPFKDKVAEVKKWHLARKFSDIGYHFLVSRTGEVIAGRALERAGAHTKGHNANSIGISLEGGYGHKRWDDFEDVYTVKQGRALRKLLDELNPDGLLMISPHNKYANKECPAFDLAAWLYPEPQPDMAEVERDFVDVKFDLPPTPKRMPPKTVAIGALVIAVFAAIVAKFEAIIDKIGGLF